MKYPYISLVTLSLIFTSCAVLKPFQTNHAQAFPLPGTYEEVRQTTLEVLREEGIPLYVSDSAKGYIQSKTFPLYRKEYKRWAQKPLFAPAGFCMVELFFSKQMNLSQTLVSARAHFRRRQPLYFFGFRKKDKSLGIFERLLIGKINDALVKKKWPKLASVVIGCTFRYDPSKLHYVVAGIEPGGLGEEQGFQNGDTLLKINGENVTSENLFRLILDVETVKTKKFRLGRKSKEVEISARIFHIPPDLPKIGIAVRRDERSQKFRITQVIQNSPASSAGILPGDVILEENQIPLTGWLDFYQAAAENPRASKFEFKIKRDDKTFMKEVKV